MRREIHIRRLAAMITAGLAISSVAVFGAPEKTEDKISREQAAKFARDGKVQHVPWTKDGNETYRIDEMEHPDGSHGYVITLERVTEDGSIEQKVISRDNNRQSHDWKIIRSNAASSTP